MSNLASFANYSINKHLREDFTLEGQKVVIFLKNYFLNEGSRERNKIFISNTQVSFCIFWQFSLCKKYKNRWRYPHFETSVRHGYNFSQCRIVSNAVIWNTKRIRVMKANYIWRPMHLYVLKFIQRKQIYACLKSTDNVFCPFLV